MEAEVRLQTAPDARSVVDRRVMAALGAVVALGAALRFYNLDWDAGAYHLHPDEWALNQVVRTLGPDLNPHFFFYGSFPVYLYRFTAEVLSALTGLDWLAQERVALIGRAYSALASTLMLPLVFAVGRRVWGEAAGLLAASCTAGAALLIQAAHFGTVDTLVTLVGVVVLWTSLNVARGGSRWYALAGVALGLGVATKLTAGSFLVMPLLAHLLGVRRSGVRRLASHRPLLLLLALAGVTVFVASPYYFLAWGELWAAIQEQARELSGGYRLSYTWQFMGSTPYLFELRNLVVWGLGVPLGVAALAGWAWALVEAVRRRATPMLLLTVWPTLYLLYIGTWEARFVRHTLPLAPFCCLFAAGGAVALLRWLRRFGQGGRLAGYAVVGGVALVALGWGLAFLAVYATPDTRLRATDWIYANAPPGTRLIVEDKNQLLPLRDHRHRAGMYHYGVLQVTSPDTREKMEEFASVLAEGDLLIVPNRRWSAVLPRHPDFPLTGRYYRLLFGGELGYTPAVTFASPPRLGPFSWPDDGAEETFQVFDHPTVRIFRNTGRLPEAELRGMLVAEP